MATVVGESIQAADERDIIGRWLLGHDPLRISADTGRKREKVAELIGRITGFDRGRGMQAARDWDQVAGTAGQETANASDELALLRRKLRESQTKFDTAQKQLRQARKELAETVQAVLVAPVTPPAVDGAAELEAQLLDLKQQLADALEREAKAPVACDHLEEMAAAEGRFSAELKQLGGHLNRAEEIAQLYKATVERVYALIGWSTKGNGAYIQVDRVRAALDGEEPS